MNYIFEEKEVFLKCKNYLLENKIKFLDYDLKNLYLINLYDDTLKGKIEMEEPLFNKRIEKDLSYGYRVTKEYKDKTTFNVGNVEVGGDKPILLSGPCSVESYEVLDSITKVLVENKVDILRAGAFKPRTSPYEFQGLGEEGLKILKEIKNKYNIPIVTEMVDVRQIEMFLDYGIDMIQVGARNINNYELLKEIGKIKTPILLKRGFSTTIKEYMQCAEYILDKGNDNIALCERGIRTFEDSTRNTMDISAIALIKSLSHLPILGDASHGTGLRKLIEPMSLAAITAGADGIIIESHINPDEAWSDRGQTIHANTLLKIKQKAYKIREIISK